MDKRVAVVTGANKGIGLEICRQLLLSGGLAVVLTARDEARGAAAAEQLRAAAAAAEGDVAFHRLDVADAASAAALADFVRARFGRLDILVNNAGVIGSSSNSGRSGGETYEEAEECLNTNYYGVKRVTNALIPLLQSSQSPRIVNVSSTLGELQYIPSESIQRELANGESLTEERLDEMVQSFLKDFKEGNLPNNGWPSSLAAYKVSKAAVNAYTRILAKRYPTVCINSVHPGYGKTDINDNAGVLPVEIGAKGPVMVALLPDGSPSGLYYDQTTVSSFI